MFLCSRIAYMAMPVYISEVSPKEHRGVLFSSLSHTYTGGTFIALCLNIGYAKFDLGWRVSFMVLSAFGLIYAVGMLFVPHTPR
jgi:MFS family permease